MGMRYFFTESISAYAELGYSAVWVFSAGLALKFEQSVAKTRGDRRAHRHVCRAYSSPLSFVLPTTVYLQPDSALQPGSPKQDEGL
ncbi:MAG: hypothetical protein LBJ41_09470 [Treponema sp.]|nr:hypothetical protein [Treponema sp.]